MILEKLEWLILILHNWKGSTQSRHRNSEEKHASGNREAFNYEWWQANWWNMYKWERSSWTRNDEVWGFFWRYTHLHAHFLHWARAQSQFHVSPILAVPDGRFGANPDITFLTTSVPNFPILKAQDVRNSARAPRSFVTWPSPVSSQVMSPKEFVKITVASLTSRKQHARTLDCLLFPQCFKSLFCKFLVVILSWQVNESHGKPWVDTEREEREGSVISVAESMSKKSRRKQYQESFSSDSQRILFRWTRSPRRPGTKSSTSHSWWKFSSEKSTLDWVWRGDPKFRSWEIQSTHHSSHSVSLNLKDNREIQKNNKDWLDVPRSIIRNHEQWVHWKIKYEDYKNEWDTLKTQIFYDPRSYSPTFHIKLLSLRIQESAAGKLECFEIHEGYEYSWKRFRLSTCSTDEILMNCTMIQETWQHHRESLMMSRILRKEGIENSGSGEPLQSTLLHCKTTNKSHVYDCIGTCTQVASQCRVISHRRCICKISLTIRKFKVGSWFSNRSLHKSELVLQWIKKIEAASSLKDLINPKPIAGKDLSDYEESDLMMAAEIWVLFQKRHL